MICTKEKINNNYCYYVFSVNNGNLKKPLTNSSSVKPSCGPAEQNELTKKMISIIIKSTLDQISLQSHSYKCEKSIDFGIDSVITNFLDIFFAEDFIGSLNYKFIIKDILSLDNKKTNDKLLYY